jgi:hypothetical protein
MAYAGFNKALQTITFSYPITSLSNVQIPSGTLGNLSLSFISNANTGIYRPAANTMALVTGGAERVRIDSTGRVGIGLDPVATLDVQTTSTNAAMSVKQFGTGPLFSCSNATSKGIFVNNEGNVGISTSQPLVPLHINSPNAPNIPNIIALPPVLILEERAVPPSIISPVTTIAITSQAVAGWHTRVLNTLVTDGMSRFMSPLSAHTGNQFRLPTGTYLIQAEGTAICPVSHRIALYDVNASSYMVFGSTEHASDAASLFPSTKSTISAVITITGTKLFELRHYVERYAPTTFSNPRGGSAVTFGAGTTLSTTAQMGQPETFARIIVTKYQ